MSFTTNILTYFLKTRTFSYITAVQLLISRNLILIQYYYPIHSSFSHLANCLKYVLYSFYPQSRIQYRTISLSFLQFLNLFLFFMTLAFLKTIIQYLQRISLNYVEFPSIYLMFLMIGFGLFFWQEYYKSGVSFSVHYFRRYVISI